MVLGVITAIRDNAMSGMAIIGLSLICAGLSIAFFLLCKALTRSFLTLLKKIYLGAVRLFTRKED